LMTGALVLDVACREFWVEFRNRLEFTYRRVRIWRTCNRNAN